MHKLLTFVGAATLLSIATPAHASDKSWDDAGSIARDALVVAKRRQARPRLSWMIAHETPLAPNCPIRARRARGIGHRGATR